MQCWLTSFRAPPSHTLPPLPTPPPAVSGVQHHSFCAGDQDGCHRWHLFGFPQLRHRCDGEDGDSKSSRCPRHGVLEYALGNRCSLRVGSLCRCDLYLTSRKFSDARGYHTGVRWCQWCLCLCRASCIVSLLGFSSCWSKVEFFRSPSFSPLRLPLSVMMVLQAFCCTSSSVPKSL